MINMNYKRAHTIVIAALFVVMIDTIYALIFYFIDLKRESFLESTIILFLFWLPLIVFGYLLWLGRRRAARVLGVLLLLHGLFYLLGSALAGSILILILAALNIIVAVYLFRYNAAKIDKITNQGKS
jgi:hypothetical protein